MPRSERPSLWSAVSADPAGLSDRFLCGAEASVTLNDLTRGSSLPQQRDELRGRSVLIATEDQLAAALALIELDGVARRLVLCPTDLPSEHLVLLMSEAAVDALVSDRSAPAADLAPPVPTIECGHTIVPANGDRSVCCQTEWILVTSGTTGRPKMVVHTLDSLSGWIGNIHAKGSRTVWSTFYDIRRYGGLQVFLRALLGGTSLVFSSARESTADFLIRAGAYGVTHISGTPSHWRTVLMSPSAGCIAPQYVRLSGEIADQPVLDHLRSLYPQSKIVHAFASTEAGVAFDIDDGLAGFPASLLDERRAGVEMRVEDGSLRIRSSRTAWRYLGHRGQTLSGADGFVDTGDMVERCGDRYYFVGRRDGIINVGGLKVHPEEVEAVINGHPQVRMSLVRTRKSPITGALVVADVVLETPQDSSGSRQLEHDILEFCRRALPRHKVPASINFVPALAIAETGKILRQHA